MGTVSWTREGKFEPDLWGYAGVHIRAERRERKGKGKGGRKSKGKGKGARKGELSIAGQ